MKKLSQVIALAGAMTAGLAAVQTAQAEVEVSASAAVSNMYLWRGMDLGGGAGQISGSLDLASGGFYAGIWAASGDTAFGNEYDLYAGYAGEAGAISYDVGYATYQYAGSDVGPNESADVYVNLGMDAFSFSYLSNMTVSGGPDYHYVALGYSMDKLSATLGYSMDADDDRNYYGFESAADENFAHLDITYAYNDNISFTASQIVMADDGVKSLEDQDMLVQFVYSLPIEM